METLGALCGLLGAEVAHADDPVCEVTVAGDSLVSRSMVELRQALGPGLCLYARPGQTAGTVVSGMATKSWLFNAPVWVVQAGSNDALDPRGEDSVAAAMRLARDFATQHGARLIWVDTYVDRYNALRMSSRINQRIRQVARERGPWSPIQVLPWSAFVRADAAHRLGYVLDGVHATPEGAAVRARLVAQAVGLQTQELNRLKRPRVSLSVSTRSRGLTRPVAWATVTVRGASVRTGATRVLLIRGRGEHRLSQWVVLDRSGTWSGRVPGPARGWVRAFVPGTLTDAETSTSTTTR